jgi:hypothetical protein
VLKAEKAELKKTSNKLNKQLETMRAKQDGYNNEAVKVSAMCNVISVLRIRNVLSWIRIREFFSSRFPDPTS